MKIYIQMIEVAIDIQIDIKIDSNIYRFIDGLNIDRKIKVQMQIDKDRYA